jgi:hypothetical protein
VFIVGGEDELDASNVCLESYDHMKIAKQNNALVVQVALHSSNYSTKRLLII